MVEPQRLTVALRAWAAEGPRARYAEEVADIYRRYRAGLEAADVVDDELFAWRALDALRADPASWGATPVFVYGFDDLDPLELDALETLARHARADVTVSIPYEPGREAFRATAGITPGPRGPRRRGRAPRGRLRPLRRRLPRRAARARARPLRGRARDGRPGRRGPLHVAGGQRAEVELCAAEVLALLLRAGTAPGAVAVVFRDPAAYASIVEQVFGAYGIPFSIDRSVELAHTALGRGLLALLRCAGAGGDDRGRARLPADPGRAEDPGARRQARGAGAAQGVHGRRRHDRALERRRRPVPARRRREPALGPRRARAARADRPAARGAARGAVPAPGPRPRRRRARRRARVPRRARGGAPAARARRRRPARGGPRPDPRPARRI